MYWDCYGLYFTIFLLQRIVNLNKFWYFTLLIHELFTMIVSQLFVRWNLILVITNTVSTGACLLTVEDVTSHNTISTATTPYEQWISTVYRMDANIYLLNVVRPVFISVADGCCWHDIVIFLLCNSNVCSPFFLFMHYLYNSKSVH